MFRVAQLQPDLGGSTPKIAQILNRQFASNVIFHSPSSADALEPEESADPDDMQTGVPGRLENPWLRWMLDAAGNVPLDVVHFICPVRTNSTAT